MDTKVYAWLKTGHLVGDFLWVGAMFVLYWLLRFHTQAPREAHDKLVLMHRSIAMMMDLAATLAIGCGVALIFFPMDTTVSTMLSQKGAGWLHIKLTVVVLGMLALHGMLRARVKQASSGSLREMPNWMWTMMLGTVVAILALVFVVRNAMATVSADGRDQSVDHPPRRS